MSDSGRPPQQLDPWASGAAADASAGGQWYINVDGKSSGPHAVAAVEHLWREAKINETTSVWTPGMGKWQPLGDVPALSYLRLQQPQRAEPTDTLAGHSRDWQAQAVQAPAVNWLVQDELEGAAAVKASGKATKPSGLPEVPSVARKDVLTNWASGFVERRRATMTNLSNYWKDLQQAQADRRRWAKIAGAATLVAAVAVGGLVLREVEARRAAAEEAALTAKSSGANAGGTGPAASGNGGAAAPGGATTGAAAAATTGGAGGGAAAGTTTPSGTTPSSASALPGTATTASGARASTSSNARSSNRASATDDSESDAGDDSESDDSGDEADDEEDQTEDAPAARASAGSTAASELAPLTQQEIIAATKPQLAGLADCIKSARASSELLPKQYTFVLDWTIRPDGGVGGQKLKGPAEVLMTRLPACFEGVMAKWRFRASPREAVIANFPLPVTLR